jgi:hypothetical protein
MIPLSTVYWSKWWWPPLLLRESWLGVFSAGYSLWLLISSHCGSHGVWNLFDIGSDCTSCSALYAAKVDLIFAEPFPILTHPPRASSHKVSPLQTRMSATSPMCAPSSNGLQNRCSLKGKCQAWVCLWILSANCRRAIWVDICFLRTFFRW